MQLKQIGASMADEKLSNAIIKDFMYSVYRKEILAYLNHIILLDEDKAKLQKIQSYINQLSSNELNEIRDWVLKKLNFPNDILQQNNKNS